MSAARILTLRRNIRANDIDSIRAYAAALRNLSR